MSFLPYFFSFSLKVAKGRLKNVSIYIGILVLKVTKSNIFDILDIN
jgi:hypothetical protein